MIKKIIFFLIILILNSNCSFDTKSGIWTGNENIKKDGSNKNSEVILFKKNKADIKEFNKDFLLKTPLNFFQKQNL